MDTDEISVYLIPIPCLLLGPATLLLPSTTCFFLNVFCGFAEPCGMRMRYYFPTGITPMPPALEAQSFNHWTTREVPPQHAF